MLLRSRHLVCALVSLLAFAVSVLGRSSSGSKVLVVLESKLDQADYSLFFDGLKGEFPACHLYLFPANRRIERGYELSFRGPKDVEPALLQYDEPQFNHVILFAPTTKCTHLPTTPARRH